MVYYLESVYGTDWVTDGQINYTTDQIAEGLQFIQDLEDAHVIPSVATIAGDGAASLDQNQNWTTDTMQVSSSGFFCKQIRKCS